MGEKVGAESIDRACCRGTVGHCECRSAPFIIAPTMLLFFPLVAPPVDDVACIAIVVDGAAGIHSPLLTSLHPVPTTRLPAGDMRTGRRGSVTFFVVLDSC